MSQPPGPFLVHALGVADSDRSRMGVDTVLQQVRDAAGPADLGRSAPSFREGQPDPDDAYADEELDRLAALADTLDPADVLHFQRTPARADGDEYR